MVIVMSFCGLCLLLAAGKILRSLIPLFQKLYLPASVIGGIVGLVLINTAGPYLSQNWFAGWTALPGFLINVVFASLFLGAPTPKLRGIWNITAPQLCFGQIIAWGQYAVGLGLTGLVLMPLFGVPIQFGNLLEIGFEGGHGTVAGLTESFEKLHWEAGKDLGFAMATAGMILGIVIGMWLINWAARHGHITNIRSFADQSKLEQCGVYPPGEQPSAGRQTVFSDSVDSLALHIALIGIAVLIGYGFKELLLLLDTVAPEGVRKMHILPSFPLFPLCMIGGLLLQMLLRITKLHIIADHAQMQRLAGAALDFLVLSAVASIRIDFVAAYWLPLLLLIVFGALWNVFGVLYLAPRLFKVAWFERAIAEFGQASGVTATGLLLLRTVDPENKTCAASAFGYKQLFHEPFMGGGIITSLALPVVMAQGGGLLFWIISVAGVIFWFLLWFFLLRGKTE